MSRNVFFITGLPRSRTAWLANYLTWGDCFCFHDALRECQHPEQLREIFGRVPDAKTVGHADPANLFFQDALLREFPEATWFIIEHERAHAEAAAEAAFGSPIDADLYLRKMAELDAKASPYHFRFSNLDECVQHIGTIATREKWQEPEARREQLCRFQVQILPTLLQADTAKGISPELLARVEL